MEKVTEVVRNDNQLTVWKTDRETVMQILTIDQNMKKVCQNGIKKSNGKLKMKKICSEFQQDCWKNMTFWKRQ